MLLDSMNIPNVRNINTNMSLGLALTRRASGFMVRLFTVSMKAAIVVMLCCIHLAHPFIKSDVQGCI